MILLTKGETADIFVLSALDAYVAGTDYDTITNYTIVFTSRGDVPTTVTTTITDSSLYPDRYSKFEINTNALFALKPFGLYDYTLTLNGLLDGEVIALEI